MKQREKILSELKQFVGCEYPEFIEALNSKEYGKQSYTFLMPAELLRPSPANRKMYPEFELFEKNPHDEDPNVRKLYDLGYGVEGLLENSKIDYDGVGNTEAVAIDGYCFIRNGDCRVFMTTKTGLELVRVYICPEDIWFDPNRSEFDDAQILSSQNGRNLLVRNMKSWLTNCQEFNAMRKMLAEDRKVDLTGNYKETKNYSFCAKERKNFAKDRDISNTHLLKGLQLIDFVGDKEARKWFKIIDVDKKFNGKSCTTPAKALEFAIDENYAECITDAKHFWKLFKKSKKMQKRFVKLFKDFLEQKFGAVAVVPGEGKVKIVFSKIAGESQSAISSGCSHSAMSAMTLVMREYGYDAYSEGKENDSVFDVEVRGLIDGERYKTSKEGYHIPVIEVKVTLINEDQGSMNGWAGGDGSGTAKTASTMDFLLIGRNEDCSKMWITITDINGGRADAPNDWKSNGSKGKDGPASSKKITANTWHNHHKDVGDFCTILGSTNDDSGKVTLVPEKL